MKYPKIPKGTAFIAVIPFVIEKADGTREPIAVSMLTDVEVRVIVKGAGTLFMDYTVSADGVNNLLLDCYKGIEIKDYSVSVTAKYAGRAISTFYDIAFEGVLKNEDATWLNYIVDDRLLMPTSTFVLSADTQAIAALTEELQQAISEAEQAKADYIAKAEQLEGVAQETTSQTILAKLDAIHIDLTPVLNKLNELKTWLGSQFTALQAWLEAHLSGVAKETNATANKQEILDAIGQIDIPTDDLATKANQQKMMVNFGMSEGEPQLQALTDTEIINTYDGYDSEGTHIEGIADQTYGHLVPAQVTIDDEPFTFYVERTYADYGYSVLYRNGVAIDTTTTHPQEDDELTITNE